MRSSKEITQEYTDLCAVLGNALLQFELQKSQMVTKFIALNQEMIEATKHEQEEAEKLAVESEKLAQKPKEPAALSLLTFEEK